MSRYMIKKLKQDGKGFQNDVALACTLLHIISLCENTDKSAEETLVEILDVVENYLKERKEGRK